MFSLLSAALPPINGAIVRDALHGCCAPSPRSGALGRGSAGAVPKPAHQPMSDTIQPPPLAELRAEIDRIDAEIHRLLMERGDIIDRLIKVKRTSESGSAFRPAREADMMRRLVERHRGILPLDTAESIWRVIISTFTFVQSPYAVHADLTPGEAAMRDSER